MLLLIHFYRVSTWAQKLGGELFNFGEYVTRMKQVEEVKLIKLIFN